MRGGKRLINSIVSVNLKSRAPGRLKGKIVAARHGGGVTVKGLRRSESGEDWLLVPYNKEHLALVEALEAFHRVFK